MSRTLSIVCASKLRFNGRYMDVLRSPQELEIIGDPSAKHLTLYTTLSVAKTLLKGGFYKIKPTKKEDAMMCESVNV